MVQAPMDSHVCTSLRTCLDVTRGDCIALIGAGGKTTAMYELAHDSARSGYAVLVTTTTKIWPPQDGLVVMGSDIDGVAATKGQVVTMGAGLGAEGKLLGVSAEVLDSQVSRFDLTLYEADGAARRPLKVHGPHEPVLAACTTHVLILAGIDVVGRPADVDSVHRLERFLDLTHVGLGDQIMPEHVALCLHTASTRVGSMSSVTYLLNKVETPEAEIAVGEVREALRVLGDLRTVLPVRRGRLCCEPASLPSLKTQSHGCSE